MSKRLPNSCKKQDYAYSPPMPSGNFGDEHEAVWSVRPEQNGAMKLYQCIFAICVLALAACGSPAATNTASEAPAATVGSLSISAPWVRATSMAGSSDETAATNPSSTGSAMDDMKIGAAYMIIANSGGADKLISISTDAAKAVELHNVVEQNGVMQMRPAEGGIDVPAGGKVELKPGGFHAMLIGLTRDLKAGDTVNFMLQFEKAGTTTVTAQVRN